MSTYKTFGSIIHQAKLEALLIFEGFSKGVTQAVGGEHTLPTLLKLAEYTLKTNNGLTIISAWVHLVMRHSAQNEITANLQCAENAGITEAEMARELPQTSPEDVQLPKHLDSFNNTIITWTAQENKSTYDTTTDVITLVLNTGVASTAKLRFSTFSATCLVTFRR